MRSRRLAALLPARWVGFQRLEAWGRNGGAIGARRRPGRRPAGPEKYHRDHGWTESGLGLYLQAWREHADPFTTPVKAMQLSSWTPPSNAYKSWNRSAQPTKTIPTWDGSAATTLHLTLPPVAAVGVRIGSAPRFQRRIREDHHQGSRCRLTDPYTQPGQSHSAASTPSGPKQGTRPSLTSLKPCTLGGHHHHDDDDDDEDESVRNDLPGGGLRLGEATPTCDFACHEVRELDLVSRKISAPCFSKRDASSGDRRASETAAASSATTGAGVSAGAHSPYQMGKAKPSAPTSASVGTSGSSGDRQAAVTPIATSVPAARWGAAIGMGDTE